MTAQPCPFYTSGNIRPSILLCVHKFVQFCAAAWRNGIASDYESGDCRFDPCGGHSVFFLLNNVEELCSPTPSLYAFNSSHSFLRETTFDRASRNRLRKPLLVSTHGTYVHVSYASRRKQRRRRRLDRLVVGSRRRKRACHNLCVSCTIAKRRAHRVILVVIDPEQWSLANRRRLRVLAQCKAEKRKMGPGYLRELEGVVYKYAALTSEDLPHHDASASVPAEPPPVALLVSESAFTRGCLLAAHASPLPFLLVHLPPSGPGGGALGTIFGNPALVSARGVLRGELEIRWEHGVSFVGIGRPRLWWQGRPLPSWTPDADPPFPA